MTLNPYVEHELITARLESVMAQEVYEDMPDAVDTQYINGLIVPYVTADYGMPFASAGGRSIAVEQKQPTDQRVIFSGVAGSNGIARQITSKMVAEMVGFVPSDNSGPLRLVGGGAYTIQVENKPTEHVSEVYFLFSSNMVDS